MSHSAPIAETPRLRLDVWTAAELPEFVRLTNTPAGMRYLGGVAGPEVFRGLFERTSLSQRENGFSFWSVRRREDDALLGICGFKRGTLDHILGEMEIGWRLREDAWGQGYAREAAGACLDWAWRNTGCARVFAVTVLANRASWGLMERLGMRRRPDMDFGHPNFPDGHPLRPHITYEVERPARTGG